MDNLQEAWLKAKRINKKTFYQEMQEAEKRGHLNE